MNGKLPYEYTMLILAEQDITFKKRLILDMLPELGLNELFEAQDMTIDLIKEYPRR